VLYLKILLPNADYFSVGEENYMNPIGVSKRRRRISLSREEGQSMTELTLLLPILLILLLGLVEFGHGLNSYLTVVASARDAARLGAQGGASQTTILANIQNEVARLPTHLDANQPCTNQSGGVCITGILANGIHDGQCSVTASPAARNYCVVVEICYEHPLIFGVPFTSLGKTLRMCSKTQMRLNESAS
jgi:Flp pilus assembly protein TadG